jgi:hypothetical protein
MAAVKDFLSVALLCACMASTARAAVLPTDLEPLVEAGYQPQGSEERDIWQRLEQVEEKIRHSPQRLIAPELDAYLRGVVERRRTCASM